MDLTTTELVIIIIILLICVYAIHSTESSEKPDGTTTLDSSSDQYQNQSDNDKLIAQKLVDRASDCICDSAVKTFNISEHAKNRLLVRYNTRYFSNKIQSCVIKKLGHEKYLIEFFVPYSRLAVVIITDIGNTILTFYPWDRKYIGHVPSYGRTNITTDLTDTELVIGARVKSLKYPKLGVGVIAKVFPNMLVDINFKTLTMTNVKPSELELYKGGKLSATRESDKIKKISSKHHSYKLKNKTEQKNLNLAKSNGKLNFSTVPDGQGESTVHLRSSNNKTYVKQRNWDIQKTKKRKSNNHNFSHLKDNYEAKIIESIDNKSLLYKQVHSVWNNLGNYNFTDHELKIIEKYKADVRPLRHVQVCPQCHMVGDNCTCIRTWY